MLSIFQGDFAHTAAFSIEALHLARSLNDPLLIGQALTLTGFLALRRGDNDRAEGLLDEAYTVLSPLGDDVPGALTDTGMVLLVLGNLDIIQERFDRAAKREAMAIKYFVRTGNDWGVGEAHSALGAALFCNGDYGPAASHYAESLRWARDLVHPLLVASSLTGLAGIAAATGNPEQGARLLGASEAVRTSLEAPIAPRDEPVRNRTLAALRAVIEPERLSFEKDAGRTLGLEVAAAEGETIAAAIPRSN
jgi:tetratricopeptide (TPR) repeat protein